MGVDYINKYTSIYLFLYQWHISSRVSVLHEKTRQRESLYNSRRRGLFECGLDGYQETIVIDDDTLEREDETTLATRP